MAITHTLVLLFALLSMALAQGWERAEIVMKDKDAITDQVSSYSDLISSQVDNIARPCLNRT